MQKKLTNIILALLAISCMFFFYKKLSNNNQEINAQKDVEQVENKLPKDFHDFYNMFHTDSVFQMSRIVFPLQGLTQSVDTTLIADEKTWQSEDWVLHKPFNDHGGTFQREFTNIGGIISEKLIGNGGMFTIEKRYAKIVGEWHLIYYQDLLMLG